MNEKTKAGVVFERCLDAEFLKPTILAFAEKVKKDITVLNPYSPCEPVIEDPDGLYIFLNCVPIECDAAEFESVYGRQLDLGADGYLLPESRLYPSGKSRIVDSEGYEVALILGKTLYILFDICNDEESANEIMEKMLDDYGLYLSHPILFAKEMQKRWHEGQLKQFVTAYRTGLSGAPEASMKEIRYRIIELREEFARLVRDQKILALEKSDLSEQEKKISEMYDRLCALSVDGKIKISDGEDRVTVHVGRIEIPFEGVVYDIGDFQIVINIFDCEVWLHNLTGRVNRFHHPNIDDDGGYCLGDATYGLAVLLGNMEFDTAVKMLIQFLKTYNPDSCLKDIKNWPVKKETENDTTLH